MGHGFPVSERRICDRRLRAAGRQGGMLSRRSRVSMLRTTRTCLPALRESMAPHGVCCSRELTAPCDGASLVGGPAVWVWVAEALVARRVHLFRRYLRR